MIDDPPRVYLDANVFIAAFENPGAHSDHAWWLLHAIEGGEIIGVTSELTLAEVLVKPMELCDVRLAEAYENVIAPGAYFEIFPVRRDILISAARLRASRASIKLPDAVHIATAQVLSCSFIVSDDRRLPAIEQMRVLSITPFTVDDILGERG